MPSVRILWDRTTALAKLETLEMEDSALITFSYFVTSNLQLDFRHQAPAVHGILP